MGGITFLWSLSQLSPPGLVPLSKPLSPLALLSKPFSSLALLLKPLSPLMPRLATCGMRLFALAMVDVSAGYEG